MRFTLMLGLGGYQDYLEVARVAEEAGWSALSLPDSIFFPRQTASAYPYADTDAVRQFLSVAPVIEPFVAIAGMAAVTRTIRFYPGVLKVPIRQPLLLAKSVASLAVMSGNRYSLGAGLSPWAEDFVYNGVPFEDRGHRMDECIEIIRGALTGDYFEYHGKHYDFGPMKMCPVPDKPVPILIGGHAKPALARAARSGDGWISANTDFATLKSLIEQIDGLRAEFGTHGKSDFEIHAFDASARTPDDFKRLRDIGVTDICTSAWNVYDASTDRKHKLDGIRRFADEIIARMN
ncbi:MAG: TIGR03619 family F420-dependent LLM class oxidoreductase [Rhodocyclaceae bacterium]|nr:TIGR03619 family F420-dependent LLM class oxidoreductase [Rhodocyclaceae bacterium]MBK6552424.1 TIGR03619 family F420-dependent LLM class oxidoreductase [Rhodocyclaceae bacterium]MBK6675652.1 TIGR03619 family F420-dependent LLM class oxidoreductase [Rhodocyclaceae bacterium]MBK9311960.1 TIGR03619 family F420-dependent LLM class oxidoreductase [Rhodocyclaceae bacterium]